MRSFFSILLLVGICCPLMAQGPVKGEAVVDQLMKSTVLIITPLSKPSRDTNKMWTFSSFSIGTGVYVGHSDMDKPVILTNYHVVRGGHQVRVVFPSQMPRLVGVSYSEDRIKEAYQSGIEIKLLEKYQSRDMALLELDVKSVKGTEPLALAAQSTRPGAEVHTMGCARGVGLFSYTKGAVRSLGKREFSIYDERQSKPIAIEMQAVETTNPLNKGDSGGPLVNEQIQLVGIAQSKLFNASLVTVFVDLHEIRSILEVNKIKLPAIKVVAGKDEKAAADKAPPRKVEAGEVKRMVQEGAPINQIARPIPPITSGAKSCIIFDRGYVARLADQSWKLMEIHAGAVRSVSLQLKTQTEETTVFEDSQNKRWLRLSKQGLEQSTNEKEWAVVDSKAQWTQ